MIDLNLLTHEYANNTTEPEEPEYEEPRTFKAAYHHEDPVQREKWREAIRKELKDMKSGNVWTKIKRSTVLKNRRCVKKKWVFKIKRSGKFRARLVACGYSQIPGIDHEENYAPVVNDDIQDPYPLYDHSEPTSQNCGY